VARSLRNCGTPNAVAAAGSKLSTLVMIGRPFSGGGAVRAKSPGEALAGMRTTLGGGAGGCLGGMFGCRGQRGGYRCQPLGWLTSRPGWVLRGGPGDVVDREPGRNRNARRQLLLVGQGNRSRSWRPSGRTAKYAPRTSPRPHGLRRVPLRWRSGFRRCAAPARPGLRSHRPPRPCCLRACPASRHRRYAVDADRTEKAFRPLRFCCGRKVGVDAAGAGQRRSAALSHQ
jgi:hypothetical protein